MFTTNKLASSFFSVFSKDRDSEPERFRILSRRRTACRGQLFGDLLVKRHLDVQVKAVIPVEWHTTDGTIFS